ncbi:MAG: FlgD immunoglobulin-like domain containing protein [Candidatus Eisenbacteria bacterium]
MRLPLFAALVVIVAAAAAATALPGPAGAFVRRVPQDHARISDALAAAAPGDSVVVAAGTYSTAANGEVFPLDVNAAGVSLLGAGMGLSVIDAANQAGAVRLRAANTRLEGFTITGGLAVRGGGVFLGVGATGTPVVARNLVLANGASDRGSGIFADLSTAPWIHHNIVWQSYDPMLGSGGDPHGVQLFGAHGIVEHNLIGRGDSNGLLNEGSASTPIVRNNIFYRNGTVGLRGRGFCALGNNATTIRNNLFFENVIAAVIIRVGGVPMDVSGTTANGIDPGDAVDGNLDADPAFVDEAAQAWQLTAGSAAIDTGWPGSPADPDGTPADLGPFWFDQATVGVPAHPVAGGLALSAAPNPLARGGIVSFRLRVAGTPGAVTLAIHDARGRRVATLGAGARSGDAVDVRWDGRGDDGASAPPGVYFARATVGAQVMGSRIVLLD